jgi:hypothetical protein
MIIFSKLIEFLLILFGLNALQDIQDDFVEFFLEIRRDEKIAVH